MNNGPRFAIVESRVTGQNKAAVQTFARLAGVSTERKLKPSEAKRFARLQTQLMRTGVVVLMTKEVAYAAARAGYESLPWRKKLSLRVRYYLRIFRTRFELRWVRLRLRLRLRS